MNYPNGIYEQLDWLTKKVNQLCCKLDFSSLPEYADNDAALAGGLLPGQLYHTNGDVFVVIPQAPVE